MAIQYKALHLGETEMSLHCISFHSSDVFRENIALFLSSLSHSVSPSWRHPSLFLSSLCSQCAFAFFIIFQQWRATQLEETPTQEALAAEHRGCHSEDLINLNKCGGIKSGYQMWPAAWEKGTNYCKSNGLWFIQNSVRRVRMTQADK